MANVFSPYSVCIDNLLSELGADLETRKRYRKFTESANSILWPDDKDIKPIYQDGVNESRKEQDKTNVDKT